MHLVDLIGYAAGTLTTLSFLPQVLKTWKSRSAKDISLAMFLMFCLGVILWIVYGAFNGDLPVILANVVTLTLASIILGFKFRYSD
ncbi:MAG: SemiSWEET transporter [Prochlorotrichaceae cyanobacterium]|jgi:MtN3 and saliva related transmembrane protein